jgi:hypothetical protein
LAAAVIADDAVLDAVGGVARGEYRVVHQLDLRRADPAVAHLREAVARTGVLQRRPVDHRHSREDPVEVLRVALRHRQALAAALRAADEVHLLGWLAVAEPHQRNGDILHFLVCGVSEIHQRLVVERKGLQRDAGCVLVPRVGAVGDVAARKRRGEVESRRGRERQPGD